MPEHHDSRGYYRLLKLESDCTTEEVIASYRKLAIELHPDKNSEPDAKERFQEVLEAYTVLKDEEKRRKYDLCIDADEFDIDLSEMHEEFEMIMKMMSEMFMGGGRGKKKTKTRGSKYRNRKEEKELGKLLGGMMFDFMNVDIDDEDDEWEDITDLPPKKTSKKKKTKQEEEDDEWEEIE